MELKTENMTLTLSNADDESRAYTVRGDVRVNDGQFAEVSNGQVYTKDGGMGVAYFNAGDNNAMSTSFQSGDLTDEQRLAVFGAIQGFVASAKTYVGSNS